MNNEKNKEMNRKRIAWSKHYDPFKMVAIIYNKKKEIITYAYNDENRHCEVSVLIKLLNIFQKNKNFNGNHKLTLAVLRISYEGLSFAKPCEKCEKFIKEYKYIGLFREIIWSNKTRGIDKILIENFVAN